MNKPYEMYAGRISYNSHKFQFETEASSAGLEPGEWPREIVTVDDHGGRVHYKFLRFEMNGDEVASAVYTSSTHALEIFND